MSVLAGGGTHLDSALGFEEATRGALKVLIEDLNDEVAARSARWAQADLAWQEFAGIDIAQIDVPAVALGGFHEGPHRSVIEAPFESFPMVAVWAWFASPETRDIDTVDRFGLRLDVEAFCATGPFTDESLMSHETIVHRRIQRMTEAINACLMRQKTLCGVVQPGIIDGPRGGLGAQSFVRREESGTGPRHLWQGSRLQYTLHRNTTF